jgi:hypothetical protein
MNTKDRGNIGETAVLAALVKQGHIVSVPWGENSPYDLILDRRDGTLLRVQCRLGRIRDGSVRFNLGSVYYCSTAKKSVHRAPIVGQVDLYGIYCPDNDKVYIVPVSQISHNSSFAMRLDPLRTNRQKNWMAHGGRWAVDFELRKSGG